MRYIPLTPQRLYCPACEETYSLPSNGTIKLYKELKCPLDKFELVYFSLGNSATAQGKGYPLCPYCYNHPPEFSENQTTSNAAALLEDLSLGDDESNVTISNPGQGQTLSGTNVKKHSASAASSAGNKGFHGMGCNACMHPSCAHSAFMNGICECPSVTEGKSTMCDGILIFDENSKPNWKLACNMCNTLLRFHGNVHDIKVHPPGSVCSEPDCGTRIITVEFNKLKPLPNGETTRTGCIVCDDLLNSMTEVTTGRSMNLTVLRQIRHKRGAGGRGRRGRGGRGGRISKQDAKMSFSDF